MATTGLGKCLIKTGTYKRTKISRGLAFALTLLLVLSPRFYVSGSKNDGILTEVIVPEGAAYAVIDVLDGVEARYRLTTYGDVYGEYSCAGYVKAYYQAMYGITVQNLTDTGPLTPSDKLMKVSTPQKGDIIFYPSPPHANNHSAIVKYFDGSRITLIEQNFKWAQDGGTYTYLNRMIPWSPEGNEYEIWRYAYEPEAQPVLIPPPQPPEEIVLSDPPPDFAGPLAEPEPAPLLTEPPNMAEPPAEPEPVLAEPPAMEPLPVTPDSPDFTNPWPVYEAMVTVGSMSISVNGSAMPIEAPALIENNRTVMPVRFVSYALGLSPDDLIWDEDTRTVSVFNKGDRIMFEAGSDMLYVNGHPAQMDCPAFIRGGYTYLPLKYLAEALNVQYEWDGVSQTVKFFKYS
jgi:hypothetical protein